MKVNVEQRTAAWEEWRNGAALSAPSFFDLYITIGGSEAAAAVGVSPYMSSSALANFKIFGKRPNYVSEAMLRGIVLEDSMRMWAEQKFGVKIHPECHQHDQHPWLIASLDGVDEHGNIYEFKYSQTKNILESYFMRHTPPPHHEIQVAHQLLASGFRGRAYLICTDGIDVTSVEVEYNEEELKLLLEFEQWWGAHIYDIASETISPKSWWRDKATRGGAS